MLHLEPRPLSSSKIPNLGLETCTRFEPHPSSSLLWQSGTMVVMVVALVVVIVILSIINIS